MFQGLASMSASTRFKGFQGLACMSASTGFKGFNGLASMSASTSDSLDRCTNWSGLLESHDTQADAYDGTGTSEKQIFLWHVWIWFLYNSMWEEVCRIIYIFDAATILAEHVEFPILFWVHRTLINLMLLPFWQKMLNFQFYSECTEHFQK